MRRARVPLVMAMRGFQAPGPRGRTSVSTQAGAPVEVVEVEGGHAVTDGRRARGPAVGHRVACGSGPPGGWLVRT